MQDHPGATGQQSLPAPIPQMRPEPPSTAHADKLYLVTRANLSAGYQTSQTVHAATTFMLEHPDLASTWHAKSDSVVVLAAPDERALIAFADKARARGIAVTTFREPDLGDELTAIALAPGEQTRKLCSNFPLAGRRLDGQADALARESRLRELSSQMRACDQVPGVQDVLTHGASVREHYLALVGHLTGRVDLTTAPNWKLPAWVDQYAPQLAASLPPQHIMERYLTLHDCGKPSVLEVGEDGRRHFPDHAAASERVYVDLVTDNGTRELTDDEAQIAYLIAHDMDAHLLKAADIPAFAQSALAPAQMLAALAEVTSNAAMFGGVDSTSFKIKWKTISARGQALCKHLFGDATDQNGPTR